MESTPDSPYLGKYWLSTGRYDTSQYSTLISQIPTSRLLNINYIQGICSAGFDQNTDDRMPQNGP